MDLGVLPILTCDNPFDWSLGSIFLTKRGLSRCDSRITLNSLGVETLDRLVPGYNAFLFRFEDITEVLAELFDLVGASNLILNAKFVHFLKVFLPYLSLTQWREVPF